MVVQGVSLIEANFFVGGYRKEYYVFTKLTPRILLEERQRDINDLKINYCFSIMYIRRFYFKLSQNSYEIY